MNWLHNFFVKQIFLSDLTKKITRQKNYYPCWLSLLLACVFMNATARAQGDGFMSHVAPLLQKHCVSCHNVDQITSGVRVDQFTDASVANEERFLRLWQNIAHQLQTRAMPPKEEPQPSESERTATVQWIEQLVQVARSRPTPKNGMTRRLTIAQYRNTLRDLLGLDEDLTESLPPDAVSREGFINNKETLQLSPLLLDAYFQIAGQALDRTLVDLDSPPLVQRFSLELGRQINDHPCPDKLILGANNHLLQNEDFVVRELAPSNPLFRALSMPTKFRFIEGYAGNDTVRGWRDYDSLYHARLRLHAWIGRLSTRPRLRQRAARPATAASHSQHRRIRSGQYLRPQS